MTENAGPDATFAAAQGGAERLLLVDDDPFVLAALERSLAGYSVLRATDVGAALALLEEHSVDLVMCDFRMPGQTGVELLRVCQHRWPNAKRVLLTAYDDLPEIVRARAEGCLQAVLAKPLNPEQLRHAVARALGKGEETSDAERRDKPLGWNGAKDLLEGSIELLTRLPRLVIRPLPKQMSHLQLQFVVPTKDLDILRDGLLSAWKWPLKPQGHALPRRFRKHPVAASFSPFAINQELFVREFEDEISGYIYVSLLPWKSESQATVALGFWFLDEHADVEKLLLELHQKAIAGIAEFPLPQLASDRPVQYSREYNWVIAPNYVGPDRRSRPTSFFNRYVFIGHRRHIPQQLDGSKEFFVDRIPPYFSYYAAAYLVLAIIDGSFTAYFAGKGSINEMNPLWRWLLVVHPWGFLIAKNSFSLATIFIVLRFLSLRTGVWLLTLNILLYLLLDLYWMWLLYP